ncbi:MAG: penicillin-binding protein activator [Acidobacteriota bacterium]|nr:MAG: penicillin-binding protein activator [Acidobacteriota bacterium]
MTTRRFVVLARRISLIPKLGVGTLAPVAPLAILVALAGLAMISCGPPAPLVIGGLIPETGTAAVYGRPIRKGMDLAVEELNAGGGILGGRSLLVDYHDTGTQGEIAEREAIDLLDSGVAAVIGPAASSVALHLVPLFKQRQIVLLSPAASSPELTSEGGDWFFRVYPSDVGEGIRMANFCRDMVLSKVAVVAVEDSFGKGVADIFTDRYQAPTRRVVYREDFSGRLTSAKAREIARELARSEAEAVYIAAYVDDMADLLKAIDAAKLNIARLATSAVTKQLVAKTGEAAEGLVFPRPAFELDNPAPQFQQFLSSYHAKYDEEPDTFAVHGYDAVKVLALAIDKAGAPRPAEIRKELLNLDYDGASGHINFDLNGDVVQHPRLYAIYHGEIVSYERFREAMVGKSILAR